MKFKLRPILSEIKELYDQPISSGRFKNYLSKLQGGTKNDFALPIVGFNPMAKEQVLQKISELENLQAEVLMQETIKGFNATYKSNDDDEYLVVLNLADDLKGGWTNFYTTDFDSKFKLNAFVTRNFCAPYFWTSESFDEAKIVLRTKEYLYRTVYWTKNPKPITLEEHLQQEVFIAAQNKEIKPEEKERFADIACFYEQHHLSEEYNLIFNFFYGDAASESLAYPQYGIKSNTGFEYAKLLAGEQR